MDKIQIRNSTADFLVFTRDAKAEVVEVRVQDSEVWLTQKAIGQLFEVDRSVVTKHLQRIYAEGEADESATCANFAQVADNGKTYQYKFYSLKAIIATSGRMASSSTLSLHSTASMAAMPRSPHTDSRSTSCITRQSWINDFQGLLSRPAYWPNSLHAFGCLPITPRRMPPRWGLPRMMCWYS